MVCWPEDFRAGLLNEWRWMQDGLSDFFFFRKPEEDNLSIFRYSSRLSFENPVDQTKSFPIHLHLHLHPAPPKKDHIEHIQQSGAHVVSFFSPKLRRRPYWDYRPWIVLQRGGENWESMELSIDIVSKLAYISPIYGT